MYSYKGEVEELMFMYVAIILAAGEGTRMKSSRSKVLHTLINKPMIQYVIDSVTKAQINKKILIVGKNREEIEKIASKDILLRTQEIGEGIPYGTGYAVMQGMDDVEDNSTVVVLTGDTPLILPETLKNLVEAHEKAGSVATVLTAIARDPKGYGRIVKDAQGNLEEIVEEKDATEEQKSIHEFNSGIFVFNSMALKEGLKELKTDNVQGELYLTDVIKIFRGRGEKVSTYLLPDEMEVFGINSKYQLSIAEEIIRERINKQYMLDGVIMENPSTIYIEEGVKIGKDTRVCSNTKILGNTSIGENCLIESGSRIVDSIVEDDVKIDCSVIEKSHIKKGADIGPFAHLRPNSVLGEGVHIGNFVEVKNSNVGNGTKAGHLAYIGDAELGERINVSCGVIFANYDGKNKHRTIVEDDAFIGSNVNLVAPVHVEKEGYVAAGSTITKDVSKGALAIERANQKELKDWVARKKVRDQIKEEKNGGKK